jgi:hypothetical protein
MIPEKKEPILFSIDSFLHYFLTATIRSTCEIPKGSLSSDPDIHYKLFQESAFHWQTSADDKLRETCNTRNR